MADSIAILALAKGDRLGFLTALRHHPGERYGEREVGLMRRLAPHLRRAVTISDILEMRTFEGLALAATLDALALGVLIVDADARVLHANSAAKTLLDTGEALHLNLSRLTAAGNRETAQLRAAISSAAVPLGALIGSEDHSSSPPASQGVRLTTSDAPPTIAHVLPLANSGLRFASSAIAAVFIKSADTDPSSSSSGVWKFFGLTAAEQRLASRLASGVTLAAAAQALGISENTAKTHLGRIYSKVGVSRQSELVALAARLAPPLRGQT